MSIDPNELRKRFLDFFDARMKDHAKAKGHGVKPGVSLALPSSSLQPPDASTLFTSAGMHQFKDDFTGNLVHGTRAAATVQKCMRTPDLENVGKTARHHTFFEMLGFFSFGDGLSGPNGSVGFFKREAIHWIWDFYTLPDDEKLPVGKRGCGLDKSKLYVSVYKGDESGNDRDDEAAGLWRDILGKVWPKAEVEKRIFFLGEHDNFWPAGAPSQGPNGVCGPCSEIFYDLGDAYGQGDVASNGDRFMEIGNIVFTQYERSGPTPGKGTLTPLPAKNIDFGGGFERLVMVLDGAKTTLDSSLFTALRKALRSSAESIAKKAMALEHDNYPVMAAAYCCVVGTPNEPSQALYGDPLAWLRAAAANLNQDYGFVVSTDLAGDSEKQEYLRSCWQDWEIREKRIADHVRAVSFAMSDGILPSNEGAGYVIRRIIRRAFRDGAALGFDGPFLHKLAPVIVEGYGDAYPELRRNDKAVIATIQQEEQQFSTTLERGLQQLSGLIRDVQAKGEKVLAGKPAFDLYQSQGLPREVVQDELAALGMTLDQVGYDAAEEKHREASKGGKQVVVFEKGWFQDLKAKAKPTEFLGYETCTATGKVLAISRTNQSFDIIEQGDTATIVLDRSPFYAESGGQTGDRGSLVLSPSAGAGEAVFEVTDTKKRDDYWLHEGKLLHGKLRVGDSVEARVDEARRNRIRHNHSATHLMHAALRKVLGDHVVQRGSEVRADGLRFDFSHPKGVTFEERQQIEKLVNQQIQANAQVGTAIMSPEEAQKAGAMALFGEKYGDKVRVLSMGVSDRTAAVPAAPAGFQPAVGSVRTRTRGYLPHWEREGGTYFVTFGLADCLPDHAREEIERERADIVETAKELSRELSDSEKARLEQLYSVRMESILNAGHGACYFKDNRCAEITANALKHFDGERYQLFAWCVMPNHVHVVFRPRPGFKLDEILHSWKSFTAHECNKVLGRSGEFWRRESFDRLIRSEQEFHEKLDYTLGNPAQAGIRDWPWVWGPATQESEQMLAPGTGAAAGGTPAVHFSMELCGGTHVARTGDIGYFRIVSEGSSSAGVRRIEAVTGPDAVEIAANEARVLAQLHALTKAQPGKVLEKVEGLIKEVKDLKSKPKQAAGAGANVLDQLRKSVETVGDVSLYVGDAGQAEASDLLTIKDGLGQDAKSFAILLGSRGEDRVSLLLGFSKDLVSRGLHAGKIVGEIARLVDGKGGGKPEIAQAGGKKPEALAEALVQGGNRLREMLKK